MKGFIFLFILFIGFHRASSGIPDCELPSITVISPEDSETLKQGTVYIIRWKASDNVGIVSRAIYYSSDYRERWTCIDSAEVNSGTYSWTVPEILSKNCTIKIFVYDAEGNMSSDESAHIFSIIPPTKIIRKLSSQTGKQGIFKEKQDSYLLHMPLPENHNVTISDIMGRELISFETTDTKQWYHLPLSLSRGMHIVTVRSSKYTFITQAYFVM